MGRLPLEGIRILEFSFMIAGPLGPRFLAEHGAEVIKVESIQRPDIFRVSGAFGDGSAGLDSSRSYGEFNRNKKNITVDLNTPKGQDVIQRLVRISDVILDNYAAGITARWGLDYESVRRIKPDIIVVNMPGLGDTGPRKHWITQGMSLMALTGMTYLWGFPDAPEPVGSQTAHPDYIAGAHAAFAIMAALHYRARTGRGQHIDLGQMEMTGSLLGPFYLDHLVNRHAAKPLGNRDPAAAPHGVYPCRGEDRWCAIAVLSDEEWQRFRQAIGDPLWASDPRFHKVLGRLQHVAELDRLVESWTSQREAREVMETLQTTGVRAGIVMTGEDLYYDPHLRARGYLTEVSHPTMKPVTYPGLSLRLSRTTGKIFRHAPLFGEHNDYVYQELLGMSAREVKELTEAGVLV